LRMIVEIVLLLLLLSHIVYTINVMNKYTLGLSQCNADDSASE